MVIVLSVILLIVIIALILALWKIRKQKQGAKVPDPSMELSAVKNEACTSNQQENYSEAYKDRGSNKRYVNLPPKPPKPPKLPEPRKTSEKEQKSVYSSCS